MPSKLSYLSHSYLPEDRAANLAIWERLSAAGLTFNVDPSSYGERPMDVTFCERMMQRSDCFVAIVPDRSSRRGGTAPTDTASPYQTWSAYQALECAMALRANKPRLFIVERGIDRGPLPDGERVLWFDRDTLELDPDFDQRVREFIEAVRAGARPDPFMPKVGLLRHWSMSDAWKELTERIRTLNQDMDGNYCYIDIDERMPDHRIVSEVRRMSLVVADLNPLNTPGWLIGMLHGRAVPLYRTCQIDGSKGADWWARSLGLLPSSTKTPPSRKPDDMPLLNGYQIDDRMRPVLYWPPADIEATARTIVDNLIAYRHRERRLEEKNGREYFLGMQGNRVFISNPGSIAHLTKPIKDASDNAGMPAFHYLSSQLDGGREWKPQLWSNIRSSDLFVGFLTADYFERRECLDEMEFAIARWERHEMLIVLYSCSPDPLPPLPKFLRRAQINSVDLRANVGAGVARELRRRLEDGARENPKATLDLLAQLVQLHVELEDVAALTQWLRDVCALPIRDAQVLSERVLRCAREHRATELVSSLYSAIRGERYGGTALGRLIFFLRRLVASEQRDTLSKLFSTMRLFRGLHNLRAWCMRGKRHEILARFKPGTPKKVLAALARAAGSSADPMQTVRLIGGELARYMELPVKDGELRDPNTRICVVSSVEHLMVPMEWAVLPGTSAPLSRTTITFRRVSDVRSTKHEILETAFHDGDIGPPRVLLFGYGSSSLPALAPELESIRDLLIKRYEKVGWPTELIECMTSPDETTEERLEMRLSGSDYDVVLLAGHVRFNSGTPELQVAPTRAGPAFVSGSKLHRWVRGSSVRFVHLSCCEGATTSADGDWKQSLCKDLLEAGVPELLAHFWEVEDVGMVAFSRTFWEKFFESFDAPAALHHARQDAGPDDALWASSLLVRQVGP